MQAEHRQLILSIRLYSLMLHAYPVSFRNEYGCEMLRLFRDDATRTVQAVGTRGLFQLWFLVFVDVLVTALSEHLWEVFNIPLEKLRRWSGPAAAISGVLFLLPFSAWFVDLNELVRLLVALPGLLLSAVGLTGLYQYLHAAKSRASMLAFGLVLAGYLLIASNIIIRLVIGLEETSPMPFLLFPGIICLMVGLTAMAVITLSHRVLGALSFAPVALVGGLVALMSAAGVTANKPSILYLVNIFSSLAILGWVLLGAALWQASRGSEGPEALT